MAAYRRVYDSLHLQADCQEPGSAPEPYVRQSSMGCLYLFLLVAGLTAYNSATVPFLLRNPNRKSFHVNRLVSSAYCSYVLRVSKTQKRNVILGKVLACNDATVREAIFICSAVNRTDEANGFGFL